MPLVTLIKVVQVFSFILVWKISLAGRSVRNLAKLSDGKCRYVASV